MHGVEKLGVKEGVGFGGVWGPINAFGNGPLDPFGWVSMVPQNLPETESMTPPHTQSRSGTSSFSNC